MEPTDAYKQTLKEACDYFKAVLESRQFISWNCIERKLREKHDEALTQIPYYRLGDHGMWLHQTLGILRSPKYEWSCQRPDSFDTWMFLLHCVQEVAELMIAEVAELAEDLNLLGGTTEQEDMAVSLVREPLALQGKVQRQTKKLVRVEMTNEAQSAAEA